MHDFGSRVVRKDLVEKERAITKSQLENQVDVDPQHVSDQTLEYGQLLKDMMQNTKHSLTMMNSANNKLFRSCKARALSEKQHKSFTTKPTRDSSPIGFKGDHKDEAARQVRELVRSSRS